METTAKHRLLVVDDYEMNRDMLSRRLMRRGFDVDCAETGEQALRMIEETDYALILLDVMMPGMDGWEVLTRLRETHTAGELPIIMATAKDQSQDVVQAFKLGANDYVTKPLDFPVVLARVNTHLSLRDAQRELAAKNEFIRRVFGRYVTTDVVDNLLERPENLELGGERRTVTILMSDVRGFSSLCERLSPEQVVRMLNIYLGAMAEVVSDHGGTVDEFIGDAVLAIFGAPTPLTDHRARGVACGLAMQLAMERVNTELVAADLPALEMGIGLNTGEVVVGNIGSEARAKYGVVGSPVNLTARIESFTIGGQVLCARACVEGLDDVVSVRRTFEVEAKGVDGPFEILDVVAMGADYNLRLPTDELSLSALPDAVPFSWVAIDGKHIVQDPRPGSARALSPRWARCLVDGEAPSPLTNVRLDFGPVAAGDVYGKVIEVDDDGGLLVRFTSVPPNVRTWLATTGGGA